LSSLVDTNQIFYETYHSRSRIDFSLVKFVFARLEFMDGGIVKVIQVDSGYSPFKVYADENWKVTATKLVTNESGQQQFELRFKHLHSAIG